MTQLLCRIRSKTWQGRSTLGHLNQRHNLVTVFCRRSCFIEFYFGDVERFGALPEPLEQQGFVVHEQIRLHAIHQLDHVLGQLFKLSLNLIIKLMTDLEG